MKRHPNLKLPKIERAASTHAILIKIPCSMSIASSERPLSGLEAICWDRFQEKQQIKCNEYF
jgi:hypothetical protein